MAEDHSCCDIPEAPELSNPAENPPADRRSIDSPTPTPNSVSAKKAPKASFKLRAAAFFAVMVLVLGLAVWLLRPTDMGGQMADYTVDMSMSGFTPGSLDLPVGKAITVELVNNESPFHASGALHQFAVDELGINETLEAKQTRVITIKADKPGEYTFYCDVCCGGKRSPTMQGKLTFH